MIRIHDIQALAEDLLGRPLTAQDGFRQKSIASAEHALGRSLPAPLETFYRLIGKLPQFTNAHEHFYRPGKLRIVDGLLMFLDENQHVCSFGVDPQERVFRCHDNERYDEKVDLQAFLNLILQYQVAQGSDYSFTVNLPEDKLGVLLAQDEWQETVNHNQLLIHRLDGFLIWYFRDASGQVMDDMIFFSGLNDPPETLIERYCLEDL